MRRNLELVRAILKSIDDQEHGSVFGSLEIDGYTEEEIGYHVYLMFQAGLLDASDGSSMDGPSPYWIPHSLTWDGHDFLDAVRDDTLWAKAKKNVIQPAGGVAFKVLLEWAKSEAKARLGLP